MDKLKEKVLKYNWWEVSYLIIFGLIMSYEFYHTTLLNLVVSWPPKSGLVLMGLSALYTVLKLIFYKVYTKKEKILSILIILAFVLPAVLTQYRFLFWIGFLIVGAKDVSFNKLLKVYLVIAITIMVVAFSASQYGIVEDFQVPAVRGEKWINRHSYGIQYPTDFAAHLFYIVMAASVLYRDKLKTFGVIWMSALVAVCAYMTANAQTTTLCLIGFCMLCALEKLLRKYVVQIEKLLRWTPVACAGIYLSLAYIYEEHIVWIEKINQLLTKRLMYGKIAFEWYDVNLFGQDVYEQGFGNGFEVTGPYFFLDNSYIKILLEYGLFAFVMVLLILLLISKKAANEKMNVLVLALVAISIHSFMEHHLINIAYNPMIFALFATLKNNNLTDRRIS